MDYEQLNNEDASSVRVTKQLNRPKVYKSQLNLLLWKNYKLQIRSIVGLLLEILVPALFAIILLPIRRIVKSEINPKDKVYDPFDVDLLPPDLVPNVSVFRTQNFANFKSGLWCFGFQPNNDFTNLIMNNFARRLSLDLHGRI
jgi:hypothetical protein